MSGTGGEGGGRRYRLENPRFVRGLIYLGIAVLMLLLVADGLIAIFHWDHHHAHFPADDISIDTWPEFYAVYGFLACLVMVLFAKALGLILKRGDRYYPPDGDGEGGEP